MRSIRGTWWLGLAIAACGSPSAEVQRATLLPAAVISTRSLDGSAPRDDAAARIVRVEHGLIPEVRVTGESGGASIEERLRAHHTPGVSIAVIHDYRVAWAKAYGVADAATGARLTDTTLMQAASISKMVAAMAALKEVEAGKIPLEGNVNQTLRSWHLPDNELTRVTPVTLRHLLSHSGGTNVPSVMQDGRAPTLLELLDGKPPAITRPVRVDAKPGTAFRYSGGGMTIVQQMLVDVERRPFPAVMNDLVLAPLGLTNSTFEQKASPERGSRAVGHDYDGSDASGEFQPWMGSAAAGLWTTPNDLAHLLVELQLALRGSSTVLSKELAERMTAPVIPTGHGNAIEMALGSFVEKHGSGTYFGHDGLGIGFVALARASKTDGEGAVVMANGQASTPLLLEILRSIAAEYAWDGWLMPPIDVAHVDPAQLVKLGGRYGSNRDDAVLIVANGERLEVREPFREHADLLPVATGVFVNRTDGTRFTFGANADGVGSLVRAAPPWPPEGSAVTLTRLPDAAAPDPLGLVESGRLDDALVLYKRMLKADPKDPATKESRFESIGEDLLYRQLDPNQAARIFQINVALHPASARACVDFAEAAFRAGRPSEAVPLYARAHVLNARGGPAGEMDEIYFRWKLARRRRLDASVK